MRRELPLLEYISIIIVVIGFLFSLFQKENKQTKQQTQTKPSMKRTVPAPVEIPREIIVPDQVSNRAKEYVEIADKARAEVEALRREKNSLEKKIRMLDQKQKVSIATAKPNQTPVKKEGRLFTKENLVEAVIFSEVLSAPRARNPHRANKRRDSSF
jgi:hypothetical protein